MSLANIIQDQISLSFHRVLAKPKGYWKKPEHQRKFFDELFHKLSLKKWEDWYNVEYNEVMKHGGQRIFVYYDDLPSALATIYPHLPWKFYNFKTLPRGIWDNKDLQRKYCDDLGKQLGFKTMEDWYSLKRENLIEEGLWSLLRHHNGSLLQLLRTAYPNYNWEETKFGKVPNGYWDIQENRLKYLEKIAKAKGIKHWEDWYDISIKDFPSRTMIGRYGSHFRFIMETYPQYPWKPWKFTRTPADKRNHRIVLDQIAIENGITHWEQWYKFNSENFPQISHILRSGYSKFIMDTYPEYDWKPWKFSNQFNLWKSERLSKDFLDWAYKKLYLQSDLDWRQVSVSQIAYLGGKGLIKMHGGFMNCINRFYPTVTWDFVGKLSPFSKSQYYLFNAIQQLFPAQVGDIHSNYLQPDLRFVDGSLMELDIFLPNLNLAFEYQGGQHYKDMIERKEVVQMRDQHKREACKRKGITLIEIPFWWDLSIESLVATINKHRPELFPNHVGKPIPETLIKQKLMLPQLL